MYQFNVLYINDCIWDFMNSIVVYNNSIAFGEQESLPSPMSGSQSLQGEAHQNVKMPSMYVYVYIDVYMCMINLLQRMNCLLFMRRRVRHNLALGMYVGAML